LRESVNVTINIKDQKNNIKSPPVVHNGGQRYGQSLVSEKKHSRQQPQWDEEVEQNEQNDQNKQNDQMNVVTQHQGSIMVNKLEPVDENMDDEKYDE